jgi:AcrR family transcriptional regulator
MAVIGRRTAERAFSRETADVRRAALIQAARESLAERGMGAVSVRDVARRAGVSPGLLRHYFGSFGQLLAATYLDTVARVDVTLDRSFEGIETAEARMRAFLRASFSAEIVDRNLLSAWLGFWELVRHDEAVAKAHAQTFGAYRSRLERLLRDLAVERGRALDVRRAAIGLSAMLDGLWLELCLDPTAFGPEEGAAIAWGWIEAAVPAV